MHLLRERCEDAGLLGQGVLAWSAGIKCTMLVMPGKTSHVQDAGARRTRRGKPDMAHHAENLGGKMNQEWNNKVKRALAG